MKSLIQYWFIALFAVLLTLELICTSLPELVHWRYITKPSILLSLTIYFYKNSAALPRVIRLFAVLALVFSLLGDVFLLFENQSEYFFILGLITFLIAHVFYIITFLKHRDKRKHYWPFLGVGILYGLNLLYILKDNLGSMIIPVGIYMAVILSMATTAFLRQNTNSKLSYFFILIGSILFIISDSILALNKFYAPLQSASTGIMLSYALAQFFIVFGLLKRQ